jgi:uncharacterized protein YndB with AHSA1/START domain
MTTTNTDRIEKQVVLSAPRSRVWRAVSDAGQFGQWFGVKLDGEFAVGARMTGHMTHPGYEHIPLNATIDRMEPEHDLAWRWHVLIDFETGRVSEASTLVEFHLEDVDGGTLLTVTESGFDSMPSEYRDIAYRNNEGGWSQQMVSIERYLSETA